MDAEDPLLTLDEKLRIICPACQHPLTYIEPVRNARHFRHPRRIGEQLIDPSLQCEARVGEITEQAVRTYNRIIDQTNIQLFQRHFYRIIAKGLTNKSNNEKEIEGIIAFVKAMINTKESAALLKNIDDWNQAWLDNIIQAYPDIVNKIRSRQNADSFAERCSIIRNLKSKIRLQDPPNLDSEEGLELYLEQKLDPSIRLLSSMIDWYDNAGHLKYSESILEEYWKLMGNILHMLEHHKSMEMRHFAYVCSGLELVARVEIAEDNSSEEDLSSIVWLTQEYMMRALHKNLFRPLHEIADDISKLIQSGVGIEQYESAIGSAMTKIDPEQWLKIIHQIDAEKTIQGNNNSSGFIYIAFNRSQEENFVRQVKIGKSKDIQKREANYQTYSPDGFTFYAVFSVLNRHTAERYVHQKLKDFRINSDSGKEWFQLGLKEADNLVSQYIAEYSRKYGFFTENHGMNGSRGFS